MCSAPPLLCRRHRSAAVASLQLHRCRRHCAASAETAQRSNIGGTLQVGTLEYRMREYRPNIALNLLKNRSCLRRFKAIFFGRYLIVRYLGDPAIQNIDQIYRLPFLQQDGPDPSHKTDICYSEVPCVPTWSDLTLLAGWGRNIIPLSLFG
jgi:hypothetical protein